MVKVSGLNQVSTWGGGLLNVKFPWAYMLRSSGSGAKSDVKGRTPKLVVNMGRTKSDDKGGLNMILKVLGSKSDVK